MILKYGSKSNSKQAVRAYSLLIGFEMSETFTKEMRDATKTLQKAAGLTVDGIAGPQTLAALCKTLPEVKHKDYSGSIYVKAVQALVSTSIDGKYGNNTRKNVIAFQTTSKLEKTGNVTLNDWLALFGCSYVQTGDSSAAQEETVVPTTGGTNTAQPVDYKQYDKRWKSKPYTITGSSKQTIGSSGCGPTSMADIMATWIDKAITPVEMCAYAIKHGFRTKNSGTAWDFFKSIAKAYGFTGFVQTKSMATCRNAIKAGAFVVASMGPGYWTSGGHYICLWRTDDTYMYANDPASSSRKKQKLKAFEEQRKQFFVFYKPGKDGESSPFEQVDDAVDTSKAIIDISYHKGAIDFDVLKPHVSLVIPRASIGSDKDTRFDEYAKALNERNIPMGVFCYSYARDAAKGEDEAIKIVKYAGGYKPLFYAIDMEQLCITHAGVKAFVKTLRDLGIARIGAYVAHHHYDDYKFDELRYLFDFIWIPRYAKPDVGKPNGKKPDWPCDLWQFTEKGRFPGINSDVDVDLVTGIGKTLEWFLGGDA